MGKIKEKLIKIIPASIMSISALVIVLNIFLISNTGFFKKDKILNDPKFDGIQQLLEHSEQGVPLTLPLGKDPITVKINNLSAEDRKKVISAINKLDNISENINFNIAEDTNIKVTAQINIYGNHTDQSVFTKKDHTMGCAKYTYNNYTGEIEYPINIYIQPMENYNCVTDYTLEYIAMHELGHAFGLTDLYNKKYENQSVMYHEITNNINLENYSEQDIAVIQQLYDNKKIVVEHPTTVKYVYKKPEEEPQME